MTARLAIRQLIPAPAGWYAVYVSPAGNSWRSPVAAFAIVDEPEGPVALALVAGERGELRPADDDLVDRLEQVDHAARCDCARPRHDEGDPAWCTRCLGIVEP